VPSTTTLRDFLDNLFLKPWKGSGRVKGILRREGVHFMGWDRLRGMRGY